MGAHRNVFEQNTILDNGRAGGDFAGASIVIRGVHHDLVFRDNTIGQSQPSSTSGPGIRIAPEAKGLKADENRFQHVSAPVAVAG
jgi:hypothetical protein